MNSIFGIDFNMDGKVNSLDDVMFLQFMEEEERRKKQESGLDDEDDDE